MQVAQKREKEKKKEKKERELSCSPFPKLTRQVSLKDIETKTGIYNNCTAHHNQSSGV